ncbi:MAG: hypothetical protein MHMPM18_002545 [Marteilia pararefringens]
MRKSLEILRFNLSNIESYHKFDLFNRYTDDPNTPVPYGMNLRKIADRIFVIECSLNRHLVHSSANRHVPSHSVCQIRGYDETERIRCESGDPSMEYCARIDRSYGCMKRPCRETFLAQMSTEKCPLDTMVREYGPLRACIPRNSVTLADCGIELDERKYSKVDGRVRYFE